MMVTFVQRGIPLVKGFCPFLQIGKLSKPLSIWFAILNWCSRSLFQLTYLPVPQALAFALWIHQNCIRCLQTNALQQKLKKKKTTGLHLTSATVGMHLGTVLGVQNSPIHQMLVMQFCRPNISLTWPICSYITFVRLSHKLNKSRLLCTLTVVGDSQYKTVQFSYLYIKVYYIWLAKCHVWIFCFVFGKVKYIVWDT